MVVLVVVSCWAAWMRFMVSVCVWLSVRVCMCVLARVQGEVGWVAEEGVKGVIGPWVWGEHGCSEI
jgi:hypothetical protein